VEIKTEADSNDTTESECSHDDKPTTGMLGFSCISDIDPDVCVCR